jgi:hypothetical protein
VKVGLRFCRIAYEIVAGRQVFHHPCLQGRHYVLAKLMAFQREHETGSAESLRDLQAAIAQVPERETAPRRRRCTRSCNASSAAGDMVRNCWVRSCRSC